MGVEKRILIEIDEEAPVPGTRGQAEAVHDAIAASGAKAGEVHSTTDKQGVRHSEMLLSYRTDQPELGRIRHALDAIAQQPGNALIEHSRDRYERQTLA